jgi:hypothetical protein
MEGHANRGRRRDRFTQVSRCKESLTDLDAVLDKAYDNVSLAA